MCSPCTCSDTECEAMCSVCVWGGVIACSPAPAVTQSARRYIAYPCTCSDTECEAMCSVCVWGGVIACSPAPAVTQSARRYIAYVCGEESLRAALHLQ
ncbi:hypothetical protein J6590_010176 [Homalodisca vitripennis]|nr:hypothetical protein J6590_010176 [Homalodisca vitripennis]